MVNKKEYLNIESVNISMYILLLQLIPVSTKIYGTDQLKYCDWHFLESVFHELL